MQGQTHQPHHFYLAWTAASLAIGRNTDHETLDHAIWVEAQGDRTVLHASNVGTYVRCTMPTLEPGMEWRHILFDKDRVVRAIAANCKSPNPTDQALTPELADRILITPDNKHVHIRHDKALDDARGAEDRYALTAELKVLDLEWPFGVIAAYDQHDRKQIDEMGWPLASAALMNGIGKLIGRSVSPLYLNNLTAVFDVTHPEVPQVRIQGSVATQAN